MSEQKRSVREEPWAKELPDYMVVAIDLLVENRDDTRELLTKLNAREADLNHRESAFVKAVGDMQALVNQILGPDSELAQIKNRLQDHDSRLGALERKTA